MDKSEVKVDERIRPFSYISDLFKHIEGFNLMGHQIGRKVGDMLELVVMAKIHSDPALQKRVVYEPKLIGATGAGHKVEFAFFEPEESSITGKPFGFVECKKVGVEVTKDSSIRDNLRSLAQGGTIRLRFSRSWMKGEVTFLMTIRAIQASKVDIDVSINGTDAAPISIEPGGAMRIVITEDGEVHFVLPDGNLRGIKGIIRVCKYVILEGIKAQGATEWGLYDCLTGPQTIEKAKQASLVAMDARKRVDGKWGRDDLREEDKSLTSVLVLTEASHWEEKSRKVITMCIDHNVIVPDEVIVEAFRLFEKEFGLTRMLPLIKKSEYLTNKRVQEILDEILTKFEGKLFYDLNLGSYADFSYEAGRIKVKPV